MEENKDCNVFEANNVKSKLDIPAGLEKCLVEFTIDVLKTKPVNITQHAVNYFTKKLQILTKPDIIGINNLHFYVKIFYFILFGYSYF
jgi:hypothetical protein